MRPAFTPVPDCEQKRRDCNVYCEGKCMALTDTNFGKRVCPFYKKSNKSTKNNS